MTKIGVLLSVSISSLLLGLIRIYQYVFSPWLGNRCRFYPSCSEYMAEALKRYGPLKGLWFGTKRVCRCNPWCSGGCDPLP